MNDVDLLLHDLNNMFPVSAEFGNDLQPMMLKKVKRHHYAFLKPGQVAVKAWQLLTGFIVTIRKDQAGKEIVERIYFPRQIVTDLASFFQEEPVRLTYLAVGEVSVLEIKKQDVLKLGKYAETDKLIQHILFIEKKFSEATANMLRMPVTESVKEFLDLYEVEGLPYCYCASLLNISEEKYKEIKWLLQRKGAVELKDPHQFDKLEELENTQYTAHKVKAYLIKNFASKDVGDTGQIAARFNITEKTLTRLFKKAFGVSVVRFIEKRRMEKARELLNDPEAQVGKVADAVGYKTIHHFSRVYKNYFGLPPKAGKKQMK
ncbi:helix-turn-helix domain-containing protein [Pedobacter africanus]